MKHKIRNGSRGVTIIEILAAAAVLFIGISYVMQVFPMGFAAANKSKNMSIAYNLAASKLEECRGMIMFGGTDPNSDTKSSYASYYGNLQAPNPDGTSYNRISTDGEFRKFSSTWTQHGGSLNPESTYFYRIEACSVVSRPDYFTEYPVQYNGNSAMRFDGTGKAVTFDTAADIGEGYEGFVGAYRITVTVRGPLPSISDADDGVFNKRFKQGACEAILSTIVTNDRLGDALLAEAIVTRSMEGSDNNNKVINIPTIPRRAKTGDYLNKIYVKGFKGEQNCHPENFTVINPARLSHAELADTGPTVVMGNVTSAINSSPTNGGTYRYYPNGAQNYTAPTVMTGKDASQLASAAATAKNGPANRATYFQSAFYDPDYSKYNRAYSGEVFDGKETKEAGGGYGPADGHGLNLYGMDNIIIYCKAAGVTDANCSFEKGGWIAESNKLIRMLPPKSAGNSTNWWCFVLLNDLYGADSDFVGRECALMDNRYDGAYELTGTSWKKYGYPAGSFNGTSIMGTRVRSLVRVESGDDYNGKTYY